MVSKRDRPVLAKFRAGDAIFTQNWNKHFDISDLAERIKKMQKYIEVRDTTASEKEDKEIAEEETPLIEKS